MLASRPGAIELASHALTRLPEDIEVGRALAEEVGIGEEKSLGPHARLAERAHDRVIVQPGQAVVEGRFPLERTPQVTEGPAFDDRDGVLHHLAGLEQREQRPRCRSRRDVVLAGADLRVGAGQRRISREQSRVLEQAPALQFTRGVRERLAARYLDPCRTVADGERRREPALEQQPACAQQQRASQHGKRGSPR